MDRHLNVAKANRLLTIFLGIVIALWIDEIYSATRERSLAEIVGVSVALVGLFSASLALWLGANRARPWARKWSAILAIPLIVGFPLFTIYSIYVLSNCKEEWVVKKYVGNLTDGFPTNN